MEGTKEIAGKIAGLDLWEKALSCNWGVKMKGLAFPYFCTVVRGDGKAVKWRLLMLDGWKTLGDFVRMRADRDFGFCSSPMELAHFELIVFPSGDFIVQRHDPGFVPRSLTAAEDAIVAKMLWEAYGVMLRLESDGALGARYANEGAMFARFEVEKGVWKDAPLAISQPPAHTETVSIPRALVSKAKDLPFAKDSAVEVDFRLNPSLVTREARPRTVYTLALWDASAGRPVGACNFSVAPDDGSLADLWQPLSTVLLHKFVETGSVPGEIKVVSGRLFRMLRPLCIELPVKLSLHDSLPGVENFFRSLSTKGNKS